MITANDLIEEAEKKSGHRFDDPNGGGIALAAIAGALGRAMEINPHDERDDIAAGYLLLNRPQPSMSPEMALLAILLGADK